MKIFKEGFTIAAVAPAGRVTRDRVDAGVRALQRMGATVKVMPHVLDGNPELAYLSAADDMRRSDLENAWLDPEVDMIWAIRGGYGCARLLAGLNWERLSERAMPVAGFSDITALHWAMTAKNCGIPLALPMFAYLDEADESTMAMMERSFNTETQEFTLPALRPGKISGMPLPGNLTVAASLCGTSYFPDTTGKILILEEIGEYPYRVDRTLQQLLLAGAFEHCAGVVFGNFTNSGKPEEIMAILQDFTGKVSVPVFYGLKYGHELPFTSIRCDRIITVK